MLYVDYDGKAPIRPECIKPGKQGDPDWNDKFPDDWWKAKFGNFCGAGTDLVLGCEPVSDLDNCCKSHDFCYL